MLPLQSIEAPPPGTADDNGETRQQKPKTLPCKYCTKRFRRVEHVQRHERTHTKEKPFACNWDRCGKTFGRRDLLVRHEKLVHLNDGSNKDGNASRPRKPSLAGAAILGPPENHVDTKPILGLQQRPPPPHYQPDAMQNSVVSSLPPDSRLTTRAPACNLDLLSDAATHLASAGEVNNLQSNSMPGLTQQPPNMPSAKGYHDNMPYGDRGGREQDIVMMNANYTTQPPAHSAFDTDYNFLLDDYAPTHFLPPSLEAEHGYGMWNRTELGRGPSKPSSAFPSRFPSVQPDARDPAEGIPRSHEDGARPPSWRMIGQADHDLIKSRFDEFSSVTPSDFIFPSRHTLQRFLEGYVSCFHESLPFLHLPTLAPTDMSPELLLAIMCVGAQYRFEPNRSHGLWYAAKAVALEQIRRRHSHEVHGLLPTLSAYSPHSTRPSPSAGFRHSFPSAHQERPMTQETHREPYSPNTPQSRMETIQALLLLFAVGIWGAKAIMHEALSLQSLLALLLRDEGLVAEPNQPTADWEAWVRFEGATRTKLVAYCFFNLCSITYYTPPLLLTSEIQLLMPNAARLWRAETAWQWQEARQAYPYVEVTFQDALARLLGHAPQGPPIPQTSLGNYVLMHALIQRIYMVKQTISPLHTHGGLKLEDVLIDEIGQALRDWKAACERHMDAKGVEYQPSEVAFNSAALIRLAYIRLYSDLNPRRSLETRDRDIIASAFNDHPLLARTPALCRAVIQAIHALSMLVKMGVNFVAKSKSREWSMQQCLCNLECAILLSKWLLTLAAIGPADPPPSAEENSLFGMVRRMLDETEFAVPINHIDPSLAGGPSNSHSSHQQPQSIDLSSTSPAKLRQLACAVVRLWAATFTEHRFEITKVMNAGLEGWANLIEKPRDRTPLGRIVTNQGLG